MNCPLNLIYYPYRDFRYVPGLDIVEQRSENCSLISLAVLIRPGQFNHIFVPFNIICHDTTSSAVSSNMFLQR